MLVWEASCSAFVMKAEEQRLVLAAVMQGIMSSRKRKF